MTEQDRWQQLIDGLRDGDRQTLQDFWDQYGPMLQRIAEKHLAPELRRRLDPEDVVQSACRTFFRRTKAGEFRLEDNESLWSLLCAITLTKVREQARFHLRQKRGLGREVHGEDATSSSGPTFDPATNSASPAEAALFADHLEHLLQGLDEEERQVVDLKLQDCTHEEIAERMGCSERTVRRLVKRVQARLKRALEGG